MAFWSRSKPTHKRAVSLDGVDAAEMVQKEKLSRQLATRLASIERPPDAPLFEHLLVFGQPLRLASVKAAPSPSGGVQAQWEISSLKPACIFTYPPDKPSTLQALEQFVFPSGFPVDKDLSRVASSVLDYHTKNPQNQFVLLLTTSLKEVFYAVCVIDEYLKPFPTFANLNREVEATNREKGINATSISHTIPKLNWSTRCYCLITRYPMFDLMFEVLLHLLDVEEKSLTLADIHRQGELNQVNRILEHLWRIEAPKPGATLNLGIPRIAKYVRPAKHEDEYLISSHCVPTTFWCLDKDMILTLVSAALLERKIVFVSANLRVLANTILSFIALLKPFVLQCVFIPILPDELLQIAEAPVPFIAGLANPKLIKSVREANPELIVVDLGAKRLYIPSDAPVPPLPNLKNLAHAIDPYVLQLKKSFALEKNAPPYKASKAQKDLVTELLRLLEQYITPYFEAFRRHCVTSLTDNVTIFVKETYLLAETDDSTSDFFLPFLETQIFAYWCDNKLKQIDAQRQTRNARKASTTGNAPGAISSTSAAHSPSSSSNFLTSSANSNLGHSSSTLSRSSDGDYASATDGESLGLYHHHNLHSSGHHNHHHHHHHNLHSSGNHSASSSSGGVFNASAYTSSAPPPSSLSSSIAAVSAPYSALNGSSAALQLGGSGSSLPRHASFDDVASTFDLESASKLLALHENPPRGLGSPSTSHRSRSASLTTPPPSSSSSISSASVPTSNDAFVAGLQFDFGDTSLSVSNDSLPGSSSSESIPGTASKTSLALPSSAFGSALGNSGGISPNSSSRSSPLFTPSHPAPTQTQSLKLPLLSSSDSNSSKSGPLEPIKED